MEDQILYHLVYNFGTKYKGNLHEIIIKDFHRFGSKFAQVLTMLSTSSLKVVRRFIGNVDILLRRYHDLGGRIEDIHCENRPPVLGIIMAACRTNNYEHKDANGMLFICFRRFIKSLEFCNYGLIKNRHPGLMHPNFLLEFRTLILCNNRMRNTNNPFIYLDLIPQICMHLFLRNLSDRVDEWSRTPMVVLKVQMQRTSNELMDRSCINTIPFLDRSMNEMAWNLVTNTRNPEYWLDDVTKLIERRGAHFSIYAIEQECDTRGYVGHHDVRAGGALSRRRALLQYLIERFAIDNPRSPIETFNSLADTLIVNHRTRQRERKRR